LADSRPTGCQSTGMLSISSPRVWAAGWRPVRAPQFQS